MDLKQLKIFRTVVEAGGVTLAAQRLNCVQSNVTARIQQMEEDLGTTLFHRTNRRMVLSSAGKTLLTYAEKILELAEEAREAVQESPLPSGPLTIGTMESTAASRMPHILALYHRLYPGVKLSLETAPVPALVEAVLDYHLDAALVAGPIHHAELDQTMVFEEELVFIASGSFDAKLSPQSLARQTFLMFRRGCPYRLRLEQWLSGFGVAATKIIGLDTYGAILGCVASGIGVSLVPRSLIEQHEERGSLRCVSVRGLSKVPTVCIRRADVKSNSALRAFLGALQQSSSPNAQQPTARPRRVATTAKV
jgi:DNA-binding transcriptional LysR family regulator